jgi:hypothetical protein
MAIIDRGLNLTDLDHTSPEEMEEFRRAYTQSKGYALPAFEFWSELRPDVLKRYRLQARQTPGEGLLTMPLSVLAHLHYYVIVGYEDGILYEVKHAQDLGATKDEVLETIAFSFIHAGPRGMRFAATSSLEYLRTYEDPPGGGATWPVGWAPDPDALAAGLDFSDPELLPGELEKIEDWYERTCGEIPAHVRFLGEHRPALLKAHRNRFENSARHALPKQMLPYMMIHFNVIRGFAEGIREGVLIARGFGVARDLAADAIAWGGHYGGPAGLAIAQKAVGDVLEAWD